MSVYGNGRISSQFLARPPILLQPNENQIGTRTQVISLTTIAVMFDQHASTSNAVDVGSQGEFRNTTPISLDPNATIPGFSEETLTVYESKVLPYQITQRTRSFDAKNCAIMELVVENTGSSALTSGKLMYLVDSDAALAPADDRGKFVPQHNMVYLLDYNEGSLSGHGFGISLLQGQLHGYGILQENQANLPDPRQGDADIQSELNNPLNLPLPSEALEGGSLNVINWLIANIPDLEAGQSTLLLFGLCATREVGDASVLDVAEDNLIANTGQLDTSYTALSAMSATETAIKPDTSSVLAGESITYTVLVTNTGFVDLHNVAVTVDLPELVEFVSVDTNQGSGTFSGGTVEATINKLAVGSNAASVDIVAKPVITTPNETDISNQAFVTSESASAQTNIVTHNVINFTDLSITKQRQPMGQLAPGQTVTYTLTYINNGPGLALSPVIVDLIPSSVTNVGFTSSGPAIQSIGSSDYVWRVEDLWPGVGGTIEITGTIDSQVQDAMSFTNTATIAAKVDAPLIDTDLADNASSAAVQVQVPQLTFSTADYSTIEGNKTALIRVELDTPAKAKIMVNYATSNGTATAGSDYESASGTLTFNPGDDSTTFPIVILDDDQKEANETIILSLSSPLNANVSLETATLTLIDNLGLARIYLPSVLKDAVVTLPPSCLVNFADTFESPTSGWPVVDDEQLQTGYSSGTYRMWAKDPNPLHYAYRTNEGYHDHEVEVTAYWIGAFTGEGYGIIFAQSDEEAALDAYVFLVNTDRREYNLIRYVNGSPTSLTRGWIPSTAIISDPLATNRLKIGHKGDEIQLFINGIQLSSIFDNALSAGRVGLAVLPYFNDPVFGTQQADVRFDDYSLYLCDSSKVTAVGNTAEAKDSPLSSEGTGTAVRPK